MQNYSVKDREMRNTKSHSLNLRVLTLHVTAFILARLSVTEISSLVAPFDHFRKLQIHFSSSISPVVTLDRT